MDKSRQYSNFGPLNQELQDRISTYLGVPSHSVVTLANATLALQAGLSTSDQGEGLEVQVPSWTFTATPAAIYNSGHIPYFVDVDDNWRASFNGRGNLIVDVLPFGDHMRRNFAPYDSFEKVLIDAAASFDALEGVGVNLDPKLGIVISLHATKLISAGEGAVFFSLNQEWVERVRAWSTFGMFGDRKSKFIGTNAKLSEYASAVGLASLDKWETKKVKLLKNLRRAQKLTLECGLTTSPSMQNSSVTPYWIVQFESEKQKQEVKEKFEISKITTRDWWEGGCHEMPAYSNFKRDKLSRTNKFAKTTLGLPFHNFLTDNEWERIEHTLKKIFI